MFYVAIYYNVKMFLGIFFFFNFLRHFQVIFYVIFWGILGD